MTEAGARSGAVSGAAKLSAVQRAVEYIKRAIVAGEVEMGAPLNEEAISRELRISRTPVREALQVLQAQGFVTIERYRGATVARLSPREVLQLFDLRVCLERHAITSALDAGGPLVLDELTAAVELGMQALALTGRAAIIAGETAADRAFHFGLVRLHPNARIEAILATTWDQVLICSSQIMRRQLVQRESLAEHEAIVDALRRGALEEALTASAEHLNRAMRRTLLSE